MPTKSVSWIHTSNDLNIFQIDKFEIIIVEAIVCENLEIQFIFE